MIYRFDNFSLDKDRYELSNDGKLIAVEPQVFDLLVYLIDNRERVVARDELLEVLWKGKVVTDAALSARLKAVRKAVGDSGSAQRVIKTIHGRGYQFVADVSDTMEGPTNITIPASADKQPFLATPDVPSIAVRAFKNLSGDPEQAWFSDGMTAAIVNALSRISNLFVVVDYSSDSDSNTDRDLKQQAKDHGVRFLLEGNIVKQAARVRVSAQLIDVVSNEQKWADRYDRELDDIFAVQDDITRNIIVALQIQLSHGEQASDLSEGTRNVEAWTLVLRGFEVIDKQRKQDVMAARKMAQQAIELDPDYVSAWSLLAYSYADDSNWEWTGPREELIQRGFDAVHRGHELDPENAMNLAALSYLHLQNQEFDKALSVSQRAVACGPNNLDALGMRSSVLSRTGAPDEAMTHVRRAIRHCPVYPSWITLQLGVCHLLTGQPELAVATIKEGVSRQPDSAECLPWLIAALMEQGSEGEAESVARSLLQMEPQFRTSRWHLSDSSDKTFSEKYRKMLSAASVPE